MSRITRGNIPEVFGTSIIDLLVGSLTLVSILWVLNSLNSGYKGRGEVNTYSAFASVGQFGSNHIVSVSVEQTGNWSCKCESVCICQSEPHITSTPINLNAKGAGISVTHEGGKKLENSLNMILRLLPENKQFTGGVQINVDNIADNIKVVIGINVCCDRREPHYVRVLRIAPGMEEKDLLLWHNEIRLRNVLNATTNISWITDFKESVKTYFNQKNIMAFNLVGSDCANDSHRTKYLTLEFDEDDGITMNLPISPHNTSNLQHLQGDLFSKLKGYADVTP